jgi:hypothetical protein
MPLAEGPNSTLGTAWIYSDGYIAMDISECRRRSIAANTAKLPELLRKPPK